MFVMFLFNVIAELEGKIAKDGMTLNFEDSENESLQLIFKSLADIDIDSINLVQKPVFIDLKEHKDGILKT
ncbi:hypothetical protein [Paenibacillus spongiae]|uniref:Uncharacterized protein n=1 Tax=Paenibacillus spongiae TaxID=2909671 RepID=A0ABY5S1A7_9BACL|nr:hypothetical protein [Paenibacillus spongiae]UVI27335.1 hypothetical protein L1F29_17815 [Paenibacillus spongiae]